MSVELYYGIASESHAALPAKTLVRETRHMNIVCGEIHEERVVLIGFYEVDSMRRY